MRNIARSLLALFWLAAATFVAQAQSELRCCHDPAPPASEETGQQLMLSGNVNTILRNGGFAQLEDWAELYRNEGLRTMSGRWKLGLFYDAMGELEITHLAPITPDELTMEGVDHRDALDRIVSMWEEAYPDSPTPFVARAALLVNRAWDARGTGPDHTRPLLALMAFRYYMAEALEQLDAHRDAAAADIHWYALRIHVGAMTGESFEDILTIALEGAEREPYYGPLWVMLADAVLSQTEGYGSRFDIIVNTAVEATHELDGDSLYTRLYWYGSEKTWGAGVFEQMVVDWARMKRGMNQILFRYPTQWNIQHFARFACIKGDLEETRRLMNMIEGPVSSRTWPNGGPTYAACQEFAFSES